jgi:hypothetical protein
MRRSFTPLTLIIATLAAGAAHAVPVVWTLQNISFVDGATASGSFTYDAATQTYTAWNITTTPTVDSSAIGFTYLPGASYTTNNYTNASTSYYLNASSFGVRNLPGPGTLQFGLVFATPLTDAGGTVALKLSGGGFESTASGFASRPVVAGVGSVVASPVPEPASAALLLAGGAALLWRRRAPGAVRPG